MRVSPKSSFSFAVFSLWVAFGGCTATLQAAVPVTIAENDSSFTLANGIVTAVVAKHDGRLISLRYQGIETLGAGYWSHSPASDKMVTKVTIDPASNSGRRGEVSVKGFSGGSKMGSGPGGGTVADIEVRYALEGDASGVYTYSIFDHPADYPAISIGEARFCAKLNDAVFDWMTVDAHRNLRVITAYDWNHGTVMNGKEMRLMNTGAYKGQVEHKYDYSANQFDTLAWGWSSSEKHIGLWFINPTVEYLSGGPTKVELSAHRDATFGAPPNDAPAVPCLLNYWRGSHYGGSHCDIAADEAWTKVVGPFLIYCNAGPAPDAMWKDALAKSKTETGAWPFDWVKGVDYPHKDQRGGVSGQLTLRDPQASPTTTLTNLLVGLAHPKETAGDRGGAVDWQQDAKHYEFWVRGGSDGSFTITNVRPDHYTLYAITDGVLGEFAKTEVTVSPGATLDLGKLIWQPVRYGKQVWDIGVPNRTGSEFFKGDDYFHWGWYLQYPKLFPDDVNYTIGKSDYRKDWFFEQVPHNESPTSVGREAGRATPWTIAFDLPDAPHGKAILRLAICGVGTKSIDVSVNDQPAGAVTGLNYNATLNRDGIGGLWTEHDCIFDAALLKAGHNTLRLTVPAGPLMNGIIYDYLRLEIDESGSTTAVPTEEKMADLF